MGVNLCRVLTSHRQINGWKTLEKWIPNYAQWSGCPLRSNPKHLTAFPCILVRFTVTLRPTVRPTAVRTIGRRGSTSIWGKLSACFIKPNSQPVADNLEINSGKREWEIEELRGGGCSQDRQSWGITEFGYGFNNTSK